MKCKSSFSLDEFYFLSSKRNSLTFLLSFLPNSCLLRNYFEYLIFTLTGDLLFGKNTQLFFGGIRDPLRPGNELFLG